MKTNSQHVKAKSTDRAPARVSEYGEILCDTLDALVTVQRKMVEAQEELLSKLEQRLSELRSLRQTED